MGLCIKVFSECWAGDAGSRLSPVSRRSGGKPSSVMTAPSGNDPPSTCLDVSLYRCLGISWCMYSNTYIHIYIHIYICMCTYIIYNVYISIYKHTHIYIYILYNRAISSQLRQFQDVGRERRESPLTHRQAPWRQGFFGNDYV